MHYSFWSFILPEGRIIWIPGNALFFKNFIGNDLKFRRRLWLVLQMSCSFLESSLSLTSALLLAPPTGWLSVQGCATQGLYEWYPMFFNPVVNYTKVLRCSHELVYPRYSLPFINLTIQLASLVILRSSLYIFTVAKTGYKLPVSGFLYNWNKPLAIALCSYYNFINCWGPPPESSNNRRPPLL